eukprot:CAMPEP_0113844016 /NCGR_PEP_ID=MMETSP0372-20130328/23_1 /TAXON_ID=340204 /ORGANISM="Lankesteria abbotti" /LENGTH=396 /DNA_ID=CAMNT_0000813013 /DNA_START=396 /DNA_END=1586 /DNA_ORIENTATION=- /assembly_acc=CAM_ASM_000359
MPNSDELHWEREAQLRAPVIVASLDMSPFHLSLQRHKSKSNDNSLWTMMALKVKTTLRRFVKSFQRDQDHTPVYYSPQSLYVPPATNMQYDDENTVHIFSLASGHMYERLLAIMMLSVRRNTSSKVHFWIIENFLSPRFIKLMPELAKRYNLAFSYVTYKWPSWLNPQTEKQRIIWAHKILFLDVLFPLRLKKVIYIDADQVVRADIKELWAEDLRGKVYGYVPFCNSNEVTKHLRFWEEGYWANHLQGKPYHISALYVVDLDEFRRQGVGDQLRIIYSQLSQDKGSLANLDQDLPNYAQHYIPIHSLPQSWLWCETWCGDKGKTEAKTIDLCNNPVTKEPKLTAARRIISEWSDYDAEVRNVESDVFDRKDDIGDGDENGDGYENGDGVRKVDEL